MSTDVVMPQMGESIAEGTIVRWIKKVGEKVERDEPLFEISTDKVDAEIPSPMAGVLTEIRHKEGETVPVNSVVAVIGPSTSLGPAPAGAKAAAPPPPATAGRRQLGADVGDAAPPAPAARPQASRSEAPPARKPAAAAAPQSSEEALRQRSSPLVRRIAKEHNVDISEIQGTGIAGRVTKDDILGFIVRGGRSGARAEAATAARQRRRARRRRAPQLRPRRSRPLRWLVRACRCRSCARRSPST